MIYATCSILPSENEKQIALFLTTEAGKQFSLLEQKSILPQVDGYDGFFMALLAKK
jgi:16S rRNA (cytosine967-C5)-methyltransferase